jgi:hypothetical protein
MFANQDEAVANVASHSVQWWLVDRAGSVEMVSVIPTQAK